MTSGPDHAISNGSCESHMTTQMDHVRVTLPMVFIMSQTRRADAVEDDKEVTYASGSL